MDNNKHKRSKFAQKRIDYIVFSKPQKARKLLRKHGVEPSRNLQEVLSQIKVLIRTQGSIIVKDLISIHPDKNVIIRIAKKDGEMSNNNTEDSFCGSCGEHSLMPSIGVCTSCNTKEKQYTVAELNTMPLKILQEHYKSIMVQSNQVPTDVDLALQAQETWNVLRKKIAEEVKEEVQEPAPEQQEKDGTITKKHLVVLALTFTAGILIGSSLK